MKAIRCRVGEKAEIVDINPGLDSLQSEVNGYIEACYPFEDRVAIVLNDEGKINGMALNRALRNRGEIYDIIAGNFLIVGLTEDNFGDLSDELAEKYKAMFLLPEIVLEYEGEIYSVPYDPDKKGRQKIELEEVIT